MGSEPVSGRIQVRIQGLRRCDPVPGSVRVCLLWVEFQYPGPSGGIREPTVAVARTQSLCHWDLVIVVLGARSRCLRACVSGIL